MRVSAVRAGSLSQFQTTLAKHASQFEADKTYTLISRLRQNVIKTGIHRLSLSYSRISLRDICVKLHLDSEEDAEYILGKAIRDGVTEGRIVPSFVHALNVSGQQRYVTCIGISISFLLDRSCWSHEPRIHQVHTVLAISFYANISN